MVNAIGLGEIGKIKHAINTVDKRVKKQVVKKRSLNPFYAKGAKMFRIFF